MYQWNQDLKAIYVYLWWMKNCKKWTLRQTNSISSYILKEKNYNSFEKYPVNAMSLKMRKKSLNQNNVLLVLYHPPFCGGRHIYSERGCHVTYVNLNSDWRIKNSDSQSELSNGHHKATTDFTWVIVSLDSVESGKPLFNNVYLWVISTDGGDGAPYIVPFDTKHD